MRDRAEGSRVLTGFSTRRLSRISLAVALAAVGSAVKLPSPVGSVALDSWPGYLLALAAGPDGALVALAGHLVSGAVAGFPLGLVLHLVVAVQMAACALLYRWATRMAGLWIGIATAVILNGIAAPLLLVPWLGLPLAASLILPLTVAAAVNVAMAGAIYKAVGQTLLGGTQSSGHGGGSRE